MKISIHQTLKSRFSVIDNPHPGFWPLQVVGMLDTMAFWSLSGILVISLTQDLQVSDVLAGQLFSTSVVAMTISMFFAGSIADSIGIRRALMLGYCGSILTRAALFVAISSWDRGTAVPVIFLALLFMGPCVAVLQTIYSVGSKLYAKPHQRTAGFNIVYVALNVGAAGAGIMIDVLFLGLDLPRYSILGVGCVIGAICLIVTAIYIPDTRARSTPEHPTIGSSTKKIVDLMRQAIQQTTFWRLMVFVALLTPVRAVLVYYVLLAPKYWLRMIGPQASIGFYQALNPILVIVGTLLVIPYISNRNVYGSITTGAMLSSIALFMLAFPPFDLGHIAASTQVMTILFLIFLTAGEITWAPRLMQYTTAVAPPGMEATYLGVSGLPLGFSKMFVAYSSGYLLQFWVPLDIATVLQSGELPYWHTPGAMWLLLGVIAISASLSLVFLRPWITHGSEFAPSNSPTAA